MGKLGQVDEIADFVVFLLSDRSGVVTGSVIDWDQNVLGGMDLSGSDCSASGVPGQAEGPDWGARLAVARGWVPPRESEHGLGSQHAFGVRRTDG